MEPFLTTHRMSTSNTQDVTIDEVMKVLRSQRTDSGSRIITMHPDATISEALRTLSDNRILSAPVVSSNNEFLAIVDMVDLVTVLVAAAISSGGNWTRAEEVLKEKMTDVLPVLRTYKQQDVGFLCDGIGTRQSVSAVVKRSFLNMHRHRIAINDCDAIVQDILSQSDILRFLQSMPEFRKAERQRTLGDAGLGDTRPIVKVGTEEKVFTALKRMIDENVRTLAVVDSGNRLVSAFYINSLRGFGGGQLNLLEDSVAEFTRRLGHAACAPLKCTVDSKLDDVISELVRTRQHHAFLTDADGHPTRVISQADILNVLFGESALRDQ